MGDTKFDDILTILQTGRWNFQYFILSAYCSFVMPAGFLSGVFMVPEVDYTCVPPYNANVTHISKDSCHYFQNITLQDGAITQEEKECIDWDFDTSIYPTSMTSEFNLVCSRAHLRATYQSTYWMANMIGGPLLGLMADRYGRKTMATLAIGCYSILHISISFISSFNIILFIRFIMGMFSNPGLYVLALEVCELKHRATVSIVLGFPWSIGSIAWAVLAYLIDDWRYLQFSVAYPMILLYPLIYSINESPRWLIVNGFSSQALSALKRAAHLNRVTLPSDQQLLEIFSDIQLKEMQMRILDGNNLETTKEGCCSSSYLPVIFRLPRLRKTLILMVIQMCCLSIFFCSLALSADIFKVDPYLYNVLEGLVDLPAYLVATPLINWVGRRKPILILKTIGGISVLSMVFIPEDDASIKMLLSMMGRITDTVVYMIILGQVIEILPTQVRMRCMGVTGTAEYLGASITPYIINVLGPKIPWFPPVFMASMCFITIAVNFQLPDTLGKPLVETVAEFEAEQYSEYESLEDHSRGPEEKSSIKKCLSIKCCGDEEEEILLIEERNLKKM